MENLNTVIIDGDRDGLARLPEPGEILVYDYRGKSELNSKNSTKPKSRMTFPTSKPPIVKAVQWNIERAYKLDEIIAALLMHDADIICLQELDIGCARSGHRNSALELAKALQMKCAFITEAVELASPLRSDRTQGGGVHGNAILSRFNFEPFRIRHTHHPVDWNVEGERYREPRRGERVILAADVWVEGGGGGGEILFPLRAYSLHLELYCGISGRIRQFTDVLEDARQHLSNRPYQLIFGDLNTMAHGIARLSPLYCCDHLRWMSLGYSEAGWWQRNIFDKVGDASSDKLNPHFFDPFCMTKDTTLQGYFGLFRGKLDWTLVRGCAVLAKGIDNHLYKWSDHKLLYVLLRPVTLSKEEDVNEDADLQKSVIIGQRAFEGGHVRRNHSREMVTSLLWTASGAFVIGAAAAIVCQQLKWSIY